MPKAASHETHEHQFCQVKERAQIS